MKPVTRLIIERLQQGVLSRNRHFALFQRPPAQGALRIHHFLRSLERDLQRARECDGEGALHVTLRPHEGDDRLVLRIELPGIRAVRTCVVSRDELSLLRGHPELRVLLAGAPSR